MGTSVINNAVLAGPITGIETVKKVLQRRPLRTLGKTTESQYLTTGLSQMVSHKK